MIKQETYDKILAAINMVWNAHRYQYRENGEPYIYHPLKVMMTIHSSEGIEFDSEIKIIALLHDVLEDTIVTKEDIEKAFGKDIANKVDVLTKKEHENYVQYIDRINNSNDATVIGIKVADLSHNLETINNIQDPKRRERLYYRYVHALETLQLNRTNHTKYNEYGRAGKREDYE